MHDQAVLNVIKKLVDEEHELRSREEQGDIDAEGRLRMKTIEVELDQCWDYLRQRRAAREYGRPEEDARLRAPEVVERYQQ
ncbi:MAG: DUF2630 family protein [Dehalococcoidia bacterium]|nr:DUF2630 family protein [Dehalococcoidia bacterium]